MKYSHKVGRPGKHVGAPMDSRARQCVDKMHVIPTKAVGEVEKSGRRSRKLGKFRRRGARNLAIYGERCVTIVFNTARADG